MREQPKEKRTKNFDEVNLGYNNEEAIKEANRCLQCKNSTCVEGCPVGIDIPAFIKLIREKKFDEALEKIKEKNTLPAICGRVCPQENHCEKNCILVKKGQPMVIGALERFVADHAKYKIKKPERLNGGKVAVVGSGPASLACASILAMLSYKVVMFEALHKPGGVLSYGIPEFRLPKHIVDKEVASIKELGVEIKLNHLIGKTITLKELLKEYDAVFIGTGAGLPKFLNIEGESINNVYSANEFLTRVNLMKAYKFPDYATPIKKSKKTVVVGGGNVTMDSARVAKRLGSNVTIIYRRTQGEMPARKEEIKHAIDEGINFVTLANPVKIIGEKDVEAIECIKTKLGEKDKFGRRRLHHLKGSNFRIDCDQVIIAIGTDPNPSIARTNDIKTRKNGTIVVDEDFQTSMTRVFAGGDIISGSATIIEAIANGKKAAYVIDDYIKKK